MVLIGGCTGFLGVSRDNLLSGPFSCLLTKARYGLETREQDFKVDYVQNLRCTIERSVGSSNRRSLYNNALDALNQTFGVFYEVPGQKDLVDVFSWVVLAQDFLPLLANEEQEALAILSYFCVLLHKLSCQWWLAGWVEHFMSKIYSSLDEEHRTWVIWPMEEIGWVPPEGM